MKKYYIVTYKVLIDSEHLKAGKLGVETNDERVDREKLKHILIKQHQLTYPSSRIIASIHDIIEVDKATYLLEDSNFLQVR